MDLANFAKAEFALDSKQEDGYSLRVHLMSAWEQSGKMPEEFSHPPLDDEIKHVWNYYGELHARRRNYGWGPKSLEFDEIEAWARLTKRRLDDWELRGLLEIDDAFMIMHAESKSKDKPNVG